MAKEYYFMKVLESNYCKIIFVLSAVLIYLLMPKKIFYEYYIILGVIFVLVAALTLTCFVRNVKERAVEAWRHGSSILGIIMIIFGFGALQVCTIGSPVCGATIGAGIFALIFPGMALEFIEKYSLVIILASIVIQVIALYFMNCFKVVLKKK